jgi:hypothetical protein
MKSPSLASLFLASAGSLRPRAIGALEAIASLVLEAAYEATMLAAVLNNQRGGSNVVLLTLLGGGAFGNEAEWINAAIRRALTMMSGFGLDVRFVSYGTPAREIVQIAKDFA